jgi:flagellar basal body P-ring formation protein FlgA
MIRTAIILLALAAPAAAQVAPPPKLKPAVTVTSDIVRIGDLLDDAGTLAATPVFRAPDLGQTGAVLTGKIMDALRAHGVVRIDTQGIPEVTVTRLSRTIAVKDIEARIARALSARYALGDSRNITIAFDRDVRAIELDASLAAELQLVRMSYDTLSRRFDLSFELDGGMRRTWRFTGSAVETVEAAVLTHPLARGEVIRANHFTLERRPKAEFVGEAPAADVIGLAARRPVRAGQALRNVDLMRPELVQRNDNVTLIYEAPGMKLTMRGKALESGAEGDTVNVQNAQSKRTIQGTVTGQGRVTVTAFSSAARLATAEAPEPDRE